MFSEQELPCVTGLEPNMAKSILNVKNMWCFSFVRFSFLLHLYSYQHAHTYSHSWHGASETNCGNSSLFPLCVSRGLGSGYHGHQKVRLRLKPSHQPQYGMSDPPVDLIFLLLHCRVGNHQSVICSQTSKMGENSWIF